MFSLTTSQIQPIGLDVGSDSIRMLQLEASAESLSVVAAARVPVPEEGRNDLATRMEMLAPILQKALRQNEFKGRSVVTQLPREIIQVKNLRLPPMPAEELEQAAEFEAANLFPFVVGEGVIRTLFAGEVRQGNDRKQEVIVLGCRREDIDRHVEQMHSCGVVVESLDFEAQSLYRGIERFIRRREDEQEVHVIVDIGTRRSQVVIGRGRDISFIKPIEVGGDQINELVSRKLSISVDEARALRRRLAESANPDVCNLNDSVRETVFDCTRSLLELLAKEVALCLRYYSVTFRGQRPAKVRLVGGESSDPQLVGVLSDQLMVPVETGRPLHSMNTARMKSSLRRGHMNEWAVALGLGLKLTRGRYGARDGKARDPNAPRDLFPTPEAADAATTPSTDVPDAAGAPKEVARA